MKRKQYTFWAALLWLAAFSACETGFDSGSTLPLAGPRSVQVTGGDRRLVLQWTKAAPAQGVIPSYEVYINEAAQAGAAEKWGTVTPDDSQLVIAGIDTRNGQPLVNGQTYYVWVKAVYAGLGSSDYSPTASGTPIPPPAAPVISNTYSCDDMIEVWWPAVDYAFTYKVYYGTGSSPEGAGMVEVSDRAAVIHDLSSGTPYTVWVKAWNTAGESGYSASTSVTPSAATSAPSAAPGQPAVTPGEGKLTLTWNQVNGVPGYKLYYGTSDNFGAATAVPGTVRADAPTVSADITGLANNTLYYVWVKSWNSQGDSSAYSPAASGTPVQKPPINFGSVNFELGTAAAEYVFAQNLPSSVFYPGGRPYTDRLTRVQETALGNLFADGAAWYLRNKLNRPIDFVFLNGGYIDNVLPAGTITVGGLSGIVKPDSRGDTLFLLTLSGAQLKAFFEDVADVVHTGRGGSGTGEFGVVSTEIRYTLQYYKPPEGTAQISPADAEAYYHGRIKPGTLTFNGAAIVDTQTYRVCTTSYVASGAYFTRLAAAANREVINTPFWHGVAAYIYDQGTVTPKTDGRIKIEGGVPLPSPWVPGTWIKP